MLGLPSNVLSMAIQKLELRRRLSLLFLLPLLLHNDCICITDAMPILEVFYGTMPILDVVGVLPAVVSWLI